MKNICIFSSILFFLLLMGLSFANASPESTKTDLVSYQTMTYTSPVGSRILLRLNGDMLELLDDSQNLLTSGHLKKIHKVIINGADNEDDCLTVDLTNGNPIPEGGLFYEGGADGFDTLVFAGGSVNEFSNIAKSPSDGDIHIDGRHVQYTGLEPIDINFNTENLIINALNNPETITIADTGGGIAIISSPSFEDMTFTIVPSTSLTIRAHGDDDIINFNYFPAGHSTLIILINGGDGTDTLNYNYGAGVHVITGANQGFIAQTGMPTISYLNINTVAGVGVIMASDCGDAPDPTYPTLLASNGARHVYGSAVYLGSCVDAEADGQPNATATGDDGAAGLHTTGICAAAGNDGDGVVFTGALVPGSNVGVTVTASAPCSLSAWIDFNANGDWADAGETIFTGLPLVAGANALNLNVPAGATLGNTFARFRVTTDGAVTFTGAASDGEVEDYQVTISVTAIESIPTLSEWGMIIFSLLVGTISVYYIRRKNIAV